MVGSLDLEQVDKIAELYRQSLTIPATLFDIVEEKEMEKQKMEEKDEKHYLRDPERVLEMVCCDLWVLRGSCSHPLLQLHRV